MKVQFIAGLYALAALANSTEAQVLVDYSGGPLPTDFAPSATAEGLSTSDLTPGSSLSGVTAEGNLQGSAGYEAIGWTTSPTPDDNSSWTFTISALAGYDVQFTNLSFRFRPAGSGPDTIRADVTTPSLGRVMYPGGAETPMVQDAPGDFVATGNVSLLSGQTATFFILAYGAQSTNGNLILDNIQVSGTVLPVPEPTTVALALLGGVLAGILRGRKREG